MLDFKHFLTCGSLLLTPFLIAGCGTAGPARSAVAGKVTVGGQPLPAGRIIFTPIAPQGGPAVTVRIAAGKYQAAKKDGPVVGKNRVAVEADLNMGFAIDDDEAFAKHGAAKIPPSPIPPGFGVNPEVSVDIKPGKTNQWDVDVPTSIQTPFNP
ncbi:MAG: hypothetical protein ACKVP0_23040 [Pirellulaceae bacterium]